MNSVSGIRFTNTRLLISRSSCQELTAAENSIVYKKNDDLVKWVEQFIILYTKCNGRKRYLIFGITDQLHGARAWTALSSDQSMQRGPRGW